MNAGWIPSMIKDFSRKKATHFQPISAMEDRLFVTAEMHGLCREDLGRVQIVSNNFHLNTLISDFLMSQRVEICFSTDLASLQDSNVLLVDIDSLGGIELVADQLRVVRTRSRSCIIILLSAEFSRDDFDADRLSVCDASLRVPFSYARLEQALIEADNNNMVWQDQWVKPGSVIWAQQSQGVSI